MSQAWRDLPFGHALRQPDQRSCGPSSLVVARMAIDPVYADRAAPRFADEVLSVHRRVTGPRDAAGALQMPWPRSLGTPPWAIARQLGAPYHWQSARLGRSRAWQRVADGVRGGHPVPLFVGSRLLPRHVVLGLAEADGVLELYDPARGVLDRVDRDAFEGTSLGLGSWDVPWFTVSP